MKVYDDNLIREIESRLDIVDIVAETVSLNRKGNRYWGICPFHQEKTPSFSVSSEKNMFYCFGCHAGGNIFTYVMKRDGLEFKEAVELLASKAGVQIITTVSPDKKDRIKRVLATNDAAAEYYHQILLNNQGQTARKYLNNRGITAESIEMFNLGYSPDSWTSVSENLLKKGFSPEEIKSAGLTRRNDEQNSYYDIFRGRIMFPIKAYNGDVVGFGGRILGDAQPKYLNTNETEIFSKRRNLYGLIHAREAIREGNEAILVEGYMDCIKMHQAGIKNTVASLGTAFTPEQAKLLCRYAEKVLIIYDADEAGQRETLRAIDILVEEGLTVYIGSLPGGKDPDECLDLFKKEEFLHYIQNNKISYIEFKVQRYLSSEKKLNMEGKIRILNAVKNDMQRLTSELEKDYYVKLLARKLILQENIIRRELNNGGLLQKPGAYGNKTKILRDNIKYGNYTLEEKILASMIKNAETFRKVKDAVGLGFFYNSGLMDLISVYDEADCQPDVISARISNMVSTTELAALHARILFLIEENLILEEREIDELILNIKMRESEIRWQKMYVRLEKLSIEGDFDSVLRFILGLDNLLNKTQKGGII